MRAGGSGKLRKRVVTKPIIVWSKEADSALEKASGEYPQNANKVKEEILGTARKLCDYPEMFPIEKFKIDNPGNYRAFEKHSYRISYKCSDQEIRTLSVRYLKPEPKRY